jgi:hypothetical protein
VASARPPFSTELGPDYSNNHNEMELGPHYSNTNLLQHVIVQLHVIVQYCHILMD